MSYGEFTGHAPLGTCAFWPVPPTSQPHEISRQGPAADPGGLHDERPRHAVPGRRRPGQATRRHAVTFEGTQHTVVFQGNKCVDDYRRQVPVDVHRAAAGRPVLTNGIAAEHVIGLRSGHRPVAPRDRAVMRVRRCCHVAGGEAVARRCWRACWWRRSRAPPHRPRPRAQSTETYGQPPVWGSCEQFVGDTSDIPTAQCGTVSVPVDYANPEGAQAQLAVIRIPATGDRIGALMVNPGGPGASAVDTVAGMGAALADTDITAISTWSASTRAASGTPPRSCAAAPTPSSTPTGANRWPTTARPASRTSKQLNRQFAQRCVAADGQRRSWPASAPRRPPGTWTWCERRSARTRSTTSGSPTAPKSARPTPSGIRDRVRAMVLDGAIDPSVDPDRREHPPDGRIPNGFRRLRRRLRAVGRTARSAPTRRSSSTATTSWSTRWSPSPARTSDPRGLSYQDAITGTVNALYTRQYWKYLTSGLLGLQRGDRPRRPAAARRRLPGPRPGRPLPELAGRVQRHPLRRRAVPDRPGGVGRRRQQIRAGRAVPEPTAPSPVLRPVMSARSGRCRRRRRRTPRCRRGPGKVVVVSTTHDPATPYQAGVDLARQMGAGADHLRRHPAHRGVQRRCLRRHRRRGFLVDCVHAAATELSGVSVASRSVTQN